MKNKKKLTEREQKILNNLAELLPRLDENGKNYLLGFGDCLRFVKRADEPDDDDRNTRRSA